MKSNNNHFEFLKHLGLTEYEAKVYVTLLGRNSFIASELAQNSGVPRAKVYGILDDLIARGLAVYKPGKIKKYSATHPERSLQRLVSEMENRTSQVKELIGKLKLKYAEGQKEVDPLEYIEILKERSQIAQKFRELEGKAKHEILVLVKPPYALGPPEVNVQEIEALKRGVQGKGIYEIGEWTANYEIFKNILKYRKIGEEVRFIQKVPMKLAIFDAKTVMLDFDDPIETDEETFTTLVISHSHFGTLMKAAFYALWSKAKEMDEIETNRRK